MGGMLGFMYQQLCFTPKPLPDHIKLDGKTAIVTGSNSGLGLEAAKELVVHGLARIVLGVRIVAKGEAAKKEILHEKPGCDVQVWEVDQDSFESMKLFGERIQSLDRVDIVILSAGIKLLEFKRSPSGHESNVQVRPPQPVQISSMCITSYPLMFRLTIWGLLF